MNWDRIECDECGYSDYDDSMSNIERTEDGVLCASCRVDKMLEQP